MNSSKIISSALLISGLFLSHNTAAQDKDSADARRDNGVDVQQADVQQTDVQQTDVQQTDDSAQTQEFDNSRQTQDVEDPSNGTSASILPAPLGFEIAGHEFRISGGKAGNLCGIMFGFDLDGYLLPSGAMMYVKPLLIFGIGRFDASGTHRFTVGYDAKMLVNMKYHFQAIALEGKDQYIRTSELRTLDFTDLPGTIGYDKRADRRAGRDQDRHGVADPNGNRRPTADVDADVNNARYHDGDDSAAADDGDDTAASDDRDDSAASDDDDDTATSDDGVYVYPRGRSPR
jgi:hypothetical protein